MSVDYEPLLPAHWADPYETYRRLRDEAPVHWAPRSELWCVSRYEDVAQVLPQVVAYEEDGTTARGLHYDSIVAVAVEGIKEQQQQIAALESENAALKSELGGLRSELGGLKASLDALQAQLTALAAPSASK